MGRGGSALEAMAVQGAQEASAGQETWEAMVVQPPYGRQTWLRSGRRAWDSHSRRAGQMNGRLTWLRIDRQAWVSRGRRAGESRDRRAWLRSGWRTWLMSGRWTWLTSGQWTCSTRGHPAKLPHFLRGLWRKDEGRVQGAQEALAGQETREAMVVQPPWPWLRHSARPPQPEPYGLHSGTIALLGLNSGTGALLGLKSGTGALRGLKSGTGLSTGTGAHSGLGSESGALYGHDESTTALLGLEVETGALSGVTQDPLPLRQHENANRQDKTRQDRQDWIKLKLFLWTRLLGTWLDSGQGLEPALDSWSGHWSELWSWSEPQLAGLASEWPAGLREPQLAGLTSERPAGLREPQPVGLSERQPANLTLEWPANLTDGWPAGLG